MFKLLKANKYKEAWYMYFDHYPTHVQYVSSVIYSMINEGDEKGAHDMLKFIYKKHNYDFDFTPQTTNLWYKI